MQETKVLAMASPLLNGFAHYGSIFSILGTEGEKYYPWLFSNFIQLVSDPVRENAGLYINIDEPAWFPRTTTFCPFIDTDIVSKRIFSISNIIDSIISAINEDYYVFMVVEQYYIPGSVAYKKYSFNHDIMVHGYDLNKQTLYVSDNFNGKYKISECHFNHFVDAFNHTDGNQDRLNEKVCLFKKRNVSTEFDMLRFVDNLNSYYTGVYPEMRSSDWFNNFEGWAKGIDVYSNLSDYLNLLINSKVSFDIRPFHTLWEHKKLMVMRIKYLIEAGILNNTDEYLAKYQHIENLSLIHRNMMLKYKFNNDPKIIRKILIDINAIVNYERELIPGILNNLQLKESNESIKLLGLEMNHRLKWCLS